MGATSRSDASIKIVNGDHNAAASLLGSKEKKNRGKNSDERDFQSRIHFGSFPRRLPARMTDSFVPLITFLLQSSLSLSREGYVRERSTNR